MLAHRRADGARAAGLGLSAHVNAVLQSIDLNTNKSAFISATREATATINNQPADLVLASGTHVPRVASWLGSCISPDIRQATHSAQMLPPLVACPVSPL
jgi:hypothetical protein